MTLSGYCSFVDDNGDSLFQSNERRVSADQEFLSSSETESLAFPVAIGDEKKETVLWWCVAEVIGDSDEVDSDYCSNVGSRAYARF